MYEVVEPGRSVFAPVCTSVAEYPVTVRQFVGGLQVAVRLPTLFETTARPVTEPFPIGVTLGMVEVVVEVEVEVEVDVEVDVEVVVESIVDVAPPLRSGLEGVSKGAVGAALGSAVTIDDVAMVDVATCGGRVTGAPGVGALSSGRRPSPGMDESREPRESGTVPVEVGWRVATDLGAVGSVVGGEFGIEFGGAFGGEATTLGGGGGS